MVRIVKKFQYYLDQKMKYISQEKLFKIQLKKVKLGKDKLKHEIHFKFQFNF